MTTLRHSAVIAKRSLIGTMRTPEALVDVTLQPIIFLLLFTYVFGGAIAGGRDPLAVADDDLDALATDLGLQLIGRAPGDDLAVIDDRDHVGQLVGLLEVLGRQQQRRALADERADDVPHPEA